MYPLYRNQVCLVPLFQSQCTDFIAPFRLRSLLSLAEITKEPVVKPLRPRPQAAARHHLRVRLGAELVAGSGRKRRSARDVGAQYTEGGHGRLGVFPACPYMGLSLRFRSGSRPTWAYSRPCVGPINCHYGGTCLCGGNNHQHEDIDPRTSPSEGGRTTLARISTSGTTVFKPKKTTSGRSKGR